MNTQLLTATFGAVELWALTTTSEDTYIRDEIYKRIAPDIARQLLAKKFPHGSATEYIELTSKDNPEKNIKSICNDIIENIISIYFTDQTYKFTDKKDQRDN